MKKANLFICIFSLLAIIVFCEKADALLFFKTVDEIIAEALQSNSPKKVEKCLDKVIEKNNQTGVLKIRRHARNMLRLQRSAIVKANQLNEAVIRNKLIPWIKIDKKAMEYFKRKQVNGNGRKTPVSAYHQ